MKDSYTFSKSTVRIAIITLVLILVVGAVAGYKHRAYMKKRCLPPGFGPGLSLGAASLGAASLGAASPGAASGYNTPGY